MNLFIIADIHGAIKPVEKAAALMREADAVIIAGDFTRHGNINDAVAILTLIESLNRQIIAVPGNWDGIRVMELLDEKGYSIHKKAKTIGSFTFFGCGGSVKSLLKTPTMFTDTEIASFLKEAYPVEQTADKHILVTHIPPKGLRDKYWTGSHGGSTAVRDFIDTHPVDIVISGHVHEARGIERHGAALVINPGAFKKGYYMIATVDDTINVEAGRI